MNATVPLAVRRDESAVEAAARMEKIARDLTVFADEFAARAATFAERAEEYRAYAAQLRAGAK